MAFTDMNDVEQELGEEKPPERNGNRNFLIIVGVLGGIMVLALLCIAGLALFRYLPGQRSAQIVNATNEAQATAIAFAASQTASAPLATATNRPTAVPTNTKAPTNTPVIVLGPTKSPTLDIALATRNALLTQTAQASIATLQPTSAIPIQPTSAAVNQPTTTVLPVTGIADELGTPGLIAAAFVLVVIIFLMRRLRTAS
jgi:cytoskeletal protein RodZ